MNIITDHAIIIIPIFVMIAAQTIKFSIFTINHGWNPHYALTPGHWPSAHAAFVSSLVVSVGFYDGTDSGIFAVATVLAIIVIYDALRIRIHIGDQGRYLNMLVQELPVDKKKFPHLKERIGHYTGEIIGGVITGIILSTITIALI
ncbi:MAG: divergent PAP2 family protein [Candidatus Moranbacteria bacterium]|nr:divergent PAP2 family protein [Candidatus Moranbacteria bacterium]